MERVRAGACDAVLIAGPTASGKSAFAISLAERCDGVVINADSMQVYRDLRILSARPDAADEARVPHRLYGHVSGEVEYSVGDYLRGAAEAISAVRRVGKLPIFVGGTGLYFRALTEGLVETPEIPAAVRAWTAGIAPENLHGELARRDPAAAERLNPADVPRLMRALEVFQATGRSIADWQAERQGAPLLSAGCWSGVFLAPQREALAARIDDRFVAMIEAGALEEVRQLLARGLPPNRGVMKAHGVPHLAAYLSGLMRLEEAVQRGQGDTRRYAKRQMTWARKFMAGWHWVAVE